MGKYGQININIISDKTLINWIYYGFLNFEFSKIKRSYYTICFLDYAINNLDCIISWRILKICKYLFLKKI